MMNAKSSSKNKNAQNLDINPKILKEMVYSRDSKEREKAAKMMAEIPHFNSDYLSHIKRLIKDDTKEVWTSATSSLGILAFSDKKAHHYLMSLVDDDFFWIKKRGISALGEYARCDHQGIIKLSSLAQTNKKEVVEEAISVLGNVAMQNDFAKGVLLDLLESEDEVVLQPTIAELGKLAKEKDGILSQLKTLLKHENNFIRLWSAQAIGEAAEKNEHALSLFWDFPDDDDVYLRRGFSKKLAILTKKEPKEALKLIETCALDSDRFVRTNSVSALGSLSEKNKQALTRIKKYLKNENADIRRGAADALSSSSAILNREILPKIKEIVKDEDYYLRSASAFTLVRITDSDPKRIFGFLKDLSLDKDEYVRRDLALAIFNVSEKSKLDVYPILEKLLEDRESQVRREAVKSLGNVILSHPEDVLAHIPDLAKDSDEIVRMNACEILELMVKTDPIAAFSHVIRFVNDESPRVWEKVAHCLKIIFDLEPDLFLLRIMNLQKELINPEILKLCAKSVKDEEIGAMCRFYVKQVADLEKLNLESFLADSVRILKHVKNLKHTECIKNLYSAFLNGIRVRDLNELALIRFETNTILPVYGFERDNIPIFEVLENLPEMALRYKQIESLSDKHIYLGKMLVTIDSALESISDDPGPEMYIMSQVLHNFRHVASDTMEALKGRANLKLTLRTKKVLPQDTITLLLGLENTGESLAENIVIKIMPSSSYKIVDKTKVITMLAHERKDAVEFQLQPKRKKGFRIKFNLTWDDFERTGKSIVFADRVSFIEIPRKFKYIPNPYITGGPIKPKSKEMFFGRGDVFKFIQDNISSAAQKNVLILQGERRTGKTSILYQVQNFLGSEYIGVFLDGQEFGATTLDYFFYKMAKHISAACKKEGIDVKAPSKQEFETDAWFTFKDRFLEELSSALENKYVVILFDEFEALEHAVTSGKLDPMIFNYVRNLMQHEEKLVFIFAGVHRLEEMMQDYWGVMFNIAMYWRISFLKESETRKLISKPVEGYNMIYDDLAVEKITRATASHPYFVQLLCRFLVNRHNNEKRNYITVQDVNEELLNVIEKAKPHFDYIWTLSSTYEKLILALLVNTLRIRTIVTQKDLLDECERLKLKIDKKKFSKALANLTTKEILEMVAFGVVHYQFKVDFIRMWVERYQPLSKVVEEIGDEIGN
jgi:HEAT repeat protein